MASHQIFRRLFPILCNASRVLPAVRSTVRMSRQALLSQNLASRLSTIRCMSSDSPLKIINIQDEDDFQKVVMDSMKPVVVDFHANWCGPCKLLGPRLETIIGEQKGRVVMAKVDIDENVEIAMRFNIESIPTVLGIKDGKIQKRFIGLMEDEDIKTFVESLL